MTPHPMDVSGATIRPRPPAQVMRLERLGASHPTRLSFLRSLLRRLAREGWRFDRPLFELDGKGVGRAIYRAAGPHRSYALVAFSHDLPDEMRSDRVIATAWDATFALFDGTPTAEDLDRLAANVPLQEAGRIAQSELTLSRANRSVRLFHHVVERLAAGLQPDTAELDAVGYLMRTTAVYGSGKFGAADRAEIAARPELQGPFQAEMLTVWLIRAFTVDLVEHLARVRGGPGAVRLDPALRRRLGVGNSTGLGMAPFLVRHPLLLNNWFAARETALARVRAMPQATPETVAAFAKALAHARENATLWHSDHPGQMAKLALLRADLARLDGHLPGHSWQTPMPWDRLWTWGEHALGTEAQEMLCALLLEPHGNLIDDLADSMSADEDAAFEIDGSMPLAELHRLLHTHYDWALAVDYEQADAVARFWYVSEEKLEPRLGRRGSDSGDDREQPLDTGRRAAALSEALKTARDNDLATFLRCHPEHRLMVRRVQITARAGHAEIRDNLIARDMLPIDLLRCKLAFFGANRFDPRSDLWVRINLFAGEPYPDEMETAR